MAIVRFGLASYPVAGRDGDAFGRGAARLTEKGSRYHSTDLNTWNLLETVDADVGYPDTLFTVSMIPLRGYYRVRRVQ